MKTALDSLIELAQAQRDEALQCLAAALGGARAAREKLALLEGYRREYVARLNARTQGGITAERLRGFRAFLDQLDAAIAQQRAVAQAEDKRAAVGRTTWQGKEARLQGYAVLRERRTAALAAAERRSEQKHSDEIAARTRPAR